jgi:hypothetical protein
VTVLAGNLGSLHVTHATLVPDDGGLTVNTGAGTGQQNQTLAITLQRSICGPLAIGDSPRLLRLTDSIVDGGGGVAITAGAAEIDSCTIFGTSAMRALEASNSIFTGEVTVARRQIGCVRFCYLPLGSRAPRRYRCQPQDAIAAQRVFPAFASATYGDPAYALQAIGAAEEMLTGADDEGELGAFHFLQATQRLANLRASLDEFLRFGLEAGVFLMT